MAKRADMDGTLRFRLEGLWVQDKCRNQGRHEIGFLVWI